MDFLGNVNHAISVLGYWIFDSKYLLLFAWPPARTVWHNHEVVMFQPRSGTAMILGLVSNVDVLSWTPSHRSNFFCTFPLHPPFTDSPSHPPPRDWAAPLFSTYCSPSFRYWITCTNKLIYLRPPPPVLHSLSCYPQPYPQVPVVPCSPAPPAHFWPLVPRPFIPLVMPSTSLPPLSTPVGYPFLVFSFPHHLLDHSPPCRPRPQACYIPVPRGFVPPVLVSFPPPLCFLFTRSCVALSLDVL